MRHRLAVLFLVGAGGGAGACTRTPPPAPVTPAEIPGLIAQVGQRPQDGALQFRLAAALSAAGRCDSGVVVVGSAARLQPDNVLGPLIVGACEEQAGRYDEAVATYNDFAAQHPHARGVAALRAKAQLALRTGAERTAQQALAREAELAQQPPTSATVAVLPLVIAGDSSVQPLSRGIAELITTDLAYIRTLRLLERIQIGVLLDELKLGASARVDPATAARVGRLLRAERMVQGTATISPSGPVQISATVVTGTGVVRPVRQVTGPFPRLLDLEKQVVLDLASELGIELTEAERQQILRQGPKSLAAFLAYSRGLEALDLGDYGAAARNFRAAAQADPGFQAAQQGQEAALAAPVAGQATGVGIVGVVDAVEQVAEVPAPGGAVGGAGGILSYGARDVVPAIGDAIADVRLPTGSSSIDRHLTPESVGLPSIVSVANGITIIFKRPP
ncbi:MAG TPA: CsgG/HfaB family protein [Gemmatimonadales bacterium]|nr:CsgG/HfaB family protein [Gemmatimonadales bacterium]